MTRFPLPMKSLIGCWAATRAPRKAASNCLFVWASSYELSTGFFCVPMRRYPAVGRCIYCGADRYSSFSGRQLAEEHIVPLALNGDLELPEASCLRCERITGRNEQLALQGAYRALRHRLKYPHRHKKEQPSSLPVFIPNATGKDSKLLISLDDYPHFHFHIRLPTPGFLLGVPLNYDYIPEQFRARWFRVFANGISEPVESPITMPYYISSEELIVS